jgi:outer membrane protein OmpA-like peptidoglycan-associated protein
MKYLKLSTIFANVFAGLLAAGAVFGQTDVPRQTTSITYPQDEMVHVQFRGTTRFPRMSGKADITRSRKNGTKISLSVSKMPRPFELGAGYATYVLWAISPDGQVDNLGEIKRQGTLGMLFDSTINVTTPLQNFSLLITAEPHFLVKRPSQAVMLENIGGVTESGRPIAMSKTVQYFGNSSDYFRDPHTPEIAETDYSKTPPTILQAKQAVALARYAGAQRDAPEDLTEAETLLQNAENGWKAGRDSRDVDVTARQAISTAAKAEETALVRKDAREKRNEKARQDADVRSAEDKYQQAETQLADLKAELASETRTRELAERDRENVNQQVKDLRDENGRLREEIGKLRADSEDAKTKLARIEGEKEAVDKQRAEEQRKSRLSAGVPVLMQSLRAYGSVRQTERGIVVTLPESYFAGARTTTLAQAADSKLSALANVLANSTDYKMVIESHTDNKGTPEELEALTQERAQAIAAKLTASGVQEGRVETKGYGASLPIVPNTTNLNRAKNRRVDVILLPVN